MTEDEVKAAKKDVKIDILMESKPLLHDKIECGGATYMVHLFDEDGDVRISAYEERAGEDEGFHIERTFSCKEIFNLAKIDRASFSSQFTYYNAILKSFKVVLGKKKVLGKRQREITLIKYVKQKPEKVINKSGSKEADVGREQGSAPRKQTLPLQAWLDE